MHRDCEATLKWGYWSVVLSGVSNSITNSTCWLSTNNPPGEALLCSSAHQSLREKQGLVGVPPKSNSSGCHGIVRANEVDIRRERRERVRGLLWLVAWAAASEPSMPGSACAILLKRFCTLWPSLALVSTNLRPCLLASSSPCWVVTSRLSLRSVLLPTRTMITSFPLSARTSSIHFLVFWNDFASRKRYALLVYNANMVGLHREFGGGGGVFWRYKGTKEEDSILEMS